MEEESDAPPADAIDCAEKPKATRGRPKILWDPFDDELFRRFRSCEAAETVQAEARYLHRWGGEQGLHADGRKPTQMIQVERIRERIKKRYGGSEGYRSTRAFHRMQNRCDVNPD
jgi:hypothetical protein